MTKENANLLNNLTCMFYDIQPDDDYLEGDEDTAETIRYVENLINNSDTPIQKKIKELIAFNSEWFPDGLSKSEQETYQHLLNTAEKSIK